jgi:ATP-dependent Clp protease ATP-binding subunit ClpC
MFERFTDRARRSVVLAQEEARRLGHTYIGTEHLLLGLIRETDGLAAQALTSLGIGLENVRGEVMKIVGEGSEPPTGHIPFSPRSKKVLELSLREALQLGHTFIGTEHILLGLVREGEGVAAQVLVARGADLHRVRATVMAALPGWSGGSAGRERPRRRTTGAEVAIADAQLLAGSARLGTQHLLEALARSDDTVAAKALAALGIDPDTLAAKLDEIAIEDTSDATPEETAARAMELRLHDDRVEIVLYDQRTIEVMRAITRELGEPVRGDDPAVGSMVSLWQAVVGGLEELRSTTVPVADPPASGGTRSKVVLQSIQSRIGRRRRNP